MSDDGVTDEMLEMARAAVRRIDGVLEVTTDALRAVIAIGLTGGQNEREDHMARLNVYRVRFEVKHSNARHTWVQDMKTVIANGDAEKAVQKVRKAELTARWEDDSGKQARVAVFRLNEVAVITDVDYP